MHEGRHEAARDYIERDRVARSASIGALVGKGYRRAYSEIVRLQQLAEVFYFRAVVLRTLRYQSRYTAGGGDRVS